MQQKILSFLLAALMLFSTTTFAPVQAHNLNTPYADNQIVSFFEQPDLIVTLDVKRILNEAAPDLLNNEASSMTKLKMIMSQISGETGVDLYKIDKATIALSLEKNKPENAVFVIQTIAPANPLVENFYLQSVNDAKLSIIKNPVLNRVSALNDKLTVNAAQIDEETLSSQTARLAIFKNKLQAIRDNLIKAKSPVAANTAQVAATIEKTEAIFKVDYNLDENIAAIEKIKKDLNAVKSNDPQAAAKISALNNQTAETEKAFNQRYANRVKLSEYLEYGENLTITDSSLDEIVDLSEKLATAATPVQKTRMAQSIRKKLAEFQNLMQSRLTNENQESDSGSAETAFTHYPLYKNVRRVDENLYGQKILTIVTETKYNGEKGEMSELDGKQEDSIVMLDDKTVLWSKRENLLKILENRDQGITQNQNLKRMLDNSPNSLVAFAADSRNLDLSEFGSLFNAQNHVLQFFGAVTEQNKEVSMTASIEKSDELMPRREQKSETKKPASNSPLVDEDSAAADLFRLVAKTLIGVEGKITLKFDKKKVARLVRETPQLLGAALSDKPAVSDNKNLR